MTVERYTTLSIRSRIAASQVSSAVPVGHVEARGVFILRSSDGILTQLYCADADAVDDAFIPADYDGDGTVHRVNIAFVPDPHAEVLRPAEAAVAADVAGGGAAAPDHPGELRAG